MLLDYLPHYADGSDRVFRVLTQPHILKLSISAQLCTHLHQLSQGALYVVYISVCARVCVRERELCECVGTCLAFIAARVTRPLVLNCV